jgi:glyoxylase-like metal-dependent hydrolase (beta-lactamase superfamily II)
MKTIKIRLSCFLLLFSVVINSQNRDIKIQVKKLTDQIYSLKGQGGNIGIFIGDDGVFMIDDQFAPLTPKILVAIKGITNKSVKYLVNTHWHQDHTGGNGNMQKQGALIVSHDNVRKRMSVDQVIRGRTRKASSKEALPVVTFTQDMMLHINNDDILISHIHNAHTDGDALVYFTNNNVLHVGDSYFQGKFPYIDLSSGGSINGYVEGLKKIILLCDNNTKIIPGHGEISNKKEVKVYLKMLTEIRTTIQKEIDKGQTLEQVTKNNKITEKYKSFGVGISAGKIRNSIYKSLKTSTKK